MIRTLGPYVEEKRLALGLNQTELAAKCNLPRTTINRIESGVTKVPSPDFRRKLAKGLGVSHVDILVAAGELELEEVESAGVQGVVEELAIPQQVSDLLNGITWTRRTTAGLLAVLRMMRDVPEAEKTT